MKRFIVCALPMLVILIVQAGQLVAYDAKPTEDEKTMVDASKAAFQATLAAYQAGAIRSIEEPYLWSRRWMESLLQIAVTPEDRLAAYKEHYERMQALFDSTMMYHNMGSSQFGTNEKFHAADYYRAESKLWLKKEKDKSSTSDGESQSKISP